MGQAWRQLLFLSSMVFSLSLRARMLDNISVFIQSSHHSY